MFMRMTLLVWMFGGVAFFLCQACDSKGSMSSQVRAWAEQLADPDPRTRDAAKAALLRLSRDQLMSTARELLAPESTYRSGEAFLGVLQAADPRLIADLSSDLLKNPTVQVKAGVISRLRKDDLHAKEVELLTPFVSDESTVVRIYAANALHTFVADEVLVRSLAGTLGSEELDQRGHPPMPACLFAKEVLASWEPREGVLKALPEAVGERDRPFYHLVDLKARLSGKTKRYLYMHIGLPTEEERMALDQLGK